jgi:hypothetical protein
VGANPRCIGDKTSNTKIDKNVNKPVDIFFPTVFTFKIVFLDVGLTLLYLIYWIADNYGYTHAASETPSPSLTDFSVRTEYLHA